MKGRKKLLVRSRGRALHQGALGSLALTSLLVLGCPNLEIQNTPAVRVVTSQGEFAMLLRTDVAPATTEAFAALVEQGFYNSTVIHRVVTGSRFEIGGFVRGGLIEKPTRDPIASEAGNGLRNVRGSIAMARRDDPDSAAAQFYINVTDNPAFDATAENPGYTVFGRVLEGLDIVDQIGAIPTEASAGFTEVPVRDISIRGAARSGLSAENTGLTGVTLETTFGPIVLGLDAAAAPLTVANFLQYVDEGFYPNTLFHRVVQGTLIQGGGLTRELTPKPVTAPAPNESGNGLKNVRGTVSAAFSGDLTTAAATFVVNVSDNPQFDASGAELGFTVFAEITEGLDVIDRIAAAATAARGDLPDVPVLDIAIERMELYEVPTSFAPSQSGNVTEVLDDTIREVLRLLIRYGVSSLG